VNLKREIEIELRFRKAVELGLVTKRINRYREKPDHTSQRFLNSLLFIPLYKQLICPVSIVT